MWSLSIAHLLFRHPTLQSLTLHFASSQGGTGLLNDIPSASTRLEELNLLSCNISPESLTTLLRLPQRLKRLTLGTPLGYSSWDRGSSSTQYITAMFPVYPTLECFRLIAAPALRTNWGQGPAIGLQNFIVLKYLEIASPSLLDPNEMFTSRIKFPVFTESRLMLPPKVGGPENIAKGSHVSPWEGLGGEGRSSIIEKAYSEYGWRRGCFWIKALLPECQY